MSPHSRTSIAARSGLPWGKSRKQKVGPNPTGVRSDLLLILPLLAGILFLVLPLVALLMRALSGLGWGGFLEILGDWLFLEAIGRTLSLALIVAAVCSVVGTVYALALVASPRYLSMILLGILLGSFWLSLLVRTFGWVLLFQPNGALDQFLQDMGVIDRSLDLLQTTTAMYPAMVHVMLPYLVLPVYAAALRLDPELLRAGESLGAGPASIIRYIILPHLRQSILAGAAMVFMLSLAFYITPLLIGGPSNLTVATLIGREFGELYNLPRGAAMALLLLAIVMSIFVVADKYANIIPRKTEH